MNAGRICLVGDIVDLERMKLSPISSKAHLSVIAKLVQLANQGTEVIYVPGNHDHDFRATVGREICGIPVMFEASHEMASGQELLVTHGGVLDGQIRQGTKLETFGAATYAVLLEIDVLYNRLHDGGWVEHRNALAEPADGTLQILNWQHDTVQVNVPDSAFAPAA